MHTDKPYYTSGDTIWFKTYLVDAVNHLPVAKSKIVYVELYTPEKRLLVEQQLLIQEGGANGAINMCNQGEAFFYQRSIPVWYQNIEDKGTIDSQLDGVTLLANFLNESQKNKRIEQQFSMLLHL